MRGLKFCLPIAFLAVSMLQVPTARAQWAVVDAPAIVQLIQEVQTTAQQLATAKAQLLQAEQALQTMTGGRGMEQLLNGTTRNYL
ncbi:MAG TPA: type IV secretion system protein, partial [Steroidobacteraceae bacterium]|nr:type IV secretion system protein [Steroidobacteraceae bacterium]